MKINRIDVISIPVADQERAKNFYRDVLGFTLLRDMEITPDARWVQLAPAGAETSIALVKGVEVLPPGGVKGLVLHTNDLAAAYRSLSYKGITLSDIHREPWGQFSTFEDPDGNGWILYQPPSRATE